MKKNFLAVCLFAAFILVSCTKGGTLDSLSGNTYTLSSTLGGPKVIPATIKDTSSGSFSGWYDEATNNLSFTLNYVKDTSTVKLDTLTSIQFYQQTPTATGGTVTRSFPLSVAISAPGKANLFGAFTRGFSGYTQLSADEKTSLISSGWYVLLVSSKFPKGIIGGQINATPNQ